MRIFQAATAAAILTGLLAVAPSAGALIQPESFSVSPKSPVTGGTVITVSDDASTCIGTIHVTLAGGPAAETGNQVLTDVGTGGWSASISVPNMTGSYTLHAQCVPTDPNAAAPLYSDEGLDITEAPVLTLDPSSGPAGTTITVDGTACSFSGVAVDLILDPQGAATVLDSAEFLTDVVDWSTTMHVPADATATADGATYEVRAHCGTSVEFSFDYDPAPFTVTAAVVPTTIAGTPTTAPAAVTATPVSAAAAFTG
ncbi:MAG: hypothetical protein ACXWB2_09775 [Acidimicrobiales bacterium]